jgi:hypothetical protein
MTAQVSTPAPSPAAPLATVPQQPQSAAVQAWNLRQREAKAISESSLLPKEFQGNIPNVLIAMEIAERIGASVFMVAQNLDIVYGRPSWRATFLIATVNASKRFSPLRFRFEGTPGKDDWGCRAVAKDLSDNEPCVGPLVSMAIVKAEGWYDRKDRSGNLCSKWRTIPELMFHYRSAAWWTRIYCPELSLGIRTNDEIEDMTIDVPYSVVDPSSTPDAKTVSERLRAKGERAEAPPSDVGTGTATAPPVETPAREPPPAAVPNDAGTIPAPDPPPARDWTAFGQGLLDRISKATNLDDLTVMADELAQAERDGAPSTKAIRNLLDERRAKLEPPAERPSEPNWAAEEKTMEGFIRAAYAKGAAETDSKECDKMVGAFLTKCPPAMAQRLAKFLREAKTGKLEPEVPFR